MRHEQKTVRGKNRFVAGRDPILPACLRAKTPPGFGGRSRPRVTLGRGQLLVFAAS